MKVRATIVCLTSLVSVGAVQAQTERTGNADARVMQQVQQLSSERATLQAENGRLKAEVEQLKQELSKASSGRSALEQRAKTAEAKAGRTELAGKQSEEEVERTRAQMQELVTKFRETAQTLRDVEGERATLKGQLTLREREFKTCVDRNAAFYLLNDEVLDRMERRGFWTNLGEQEPFTRLKRTELENLVEDYRYRADELRLEAERRADAGGGS